MTSYSAIPISRWDKLEFGRTALMPNPGDSTPTQLPAEDAFLGLLIETLDNLDRSARGTFRKHGQADFI